MSQTLIPNALSTAELESGLRLSVSSTVTEISCVLSARSLGKTCFRCIAHAGASIPTQAGVQTVVWTCRRQLCTRVVGDTCSCIIYKRSKSVSPKIRRAGEHHQTCAKLSQTKLHHVGTLYEVFVSAYVMLGVSYSRFVFNRRAVEKSRSHKTQ